MLHRRRFAGLASVAAALLLAGPRPASASEGRASTSRHSLEISYFGQNFVRPGAQVGYSFRALRSRSGDHALVVGGDVGAYHWARHDVGLFVVPRLGWRGKHPRIGLQGEANLHVGYLQGFLASPNYEVVDGEVRSASRRGYPYLMFGPTVGMGWAIERIGVTPFVRTGVYWQYPVFDAALMRFSLAVGLEVRI